MNVCFTGHRPNKLGGYDWNTKKNQVIMDKLKGLVSKLILEYDATHFICGGALGIDQMAFTTCEITKLNYSHITTELAIPFLMQDCKWVSSSIELYNNQKRCADIVTYVDKLEDYKIKGYQEDIYYPAKMQKRNEYMVNNSDIVVAVWDGTKGGTANCVGYAKKQGKTIIKLDPNTLKIEIIK